MKTTATKVSGLILGVALATGACGASGTHARQPSQPCNLANLDREIVRDGVTWDCERHVSTTKKRKKALFSKRYKTVKVKHTTYRWEVDD